MTRRLFAVWVAIVLAACTGPVLTPTATPIPPAPETPQPPTATATETALPSPTQQTAEPPAVTALPAAEATCAEPVCPIYASQIALAYGEVARYAGQGEGMLVERAWFCSVRSGAVLCSSTGEGLNPAGRLVLLCQVPEGYVECDLLEGP
jgi:hypothetical protein